MATRLCSVVIDCVDPLPLGRWWAETLDWEASTPDPGEVELRAPGSITAVPTLLFLAVPGSKRTKNRIHLDLASQSHAEQAAIVDRLLTRGAARVAIGQAGTPWVVLADPEGNEFCVLEPRQLYRDVGALAGITMDAADPRAVAPFWVAATGWPIQSQAEAGVMLVPPRGRPPDLALVRVDEPKQTKLRWHLDLEPIGATSVEHEAARLRSLGAVDVDIGQHGDPTTDWIVLADPEGNELCVVPPR